MASAGFREALGSTDELQMTVTGRKTGKKLSTPVWLVNEGDKLYLLPVRGSANHWYKNMLQQPTIELMVGGVRATVKAHPIVDRQKVSDVADKLRSKHGADEVRRYYSMFDAAVELPI